MPDMPTGGGISPRWIAFRASAVTTKIFRTNPPGKEVICPVPYYGIEYLRRKLRSKQFRVRLRYRFYEQKNLLQDFGISTPPRLRDWQTALPWCTKAVDTLAKRLRFRGFRDDFFALDEIYRLNNRDLIFRSAIQSALIAACSFIYISEDATGYPRLQILDGRSATGILDPITNLLSEGYAVLDWYDPARLAYGMSGVGGSGGLAGSGGVWPEWENSTFADSAVPPFREAYFTAGYTYLYENGRYTGTAYPNSAPYPLLVPIIFQPDASRPFGHSRISRACMDLVGEAMRTLKRAEISAEFYSFPQKYFLGLENGVEFPDKWAATMSSMITVTKAEDGTIPQAGQFSQGSMTPHAEQLKMIAGQFAAAADLTLDDMGFPTDNPSSAEAIKSAHENLRLAAVDAQQTFGTGFLNAGYLAACVRDRFAYTRQQLSLEQPVWEPVFTPDAAMLAGIGDAVGKINTAVPGYFGQDNLRDLTGIEGESV